MFCVLFSCTNISAVPSSGHGAPVQETLKSPNNVIAAKWEFLLWKIKMLLPQEIPNHLFP